MHRITQTGLWHAPRGPLLQVPGYWNWGDFCITFGYYSWQWGKCSWRWVLSARLLQRGEGWWEKVMEYTGFITQGLSLWGTDAFLFTVHFPLYHLCLENRDIQGCLKLLIFKLFIIGHFSQGTAAKAFFQKDEISSAVTMGKLLVAELRQGWRKVKAVRVNPRWDASLHLHATS